jgi:hypothetical protein
MWKTIKTGAKKHKNDQIFDVSRGEFIPIGPKEIGKPVSEDSPGVRRWVNPAGRKLRTGEATERVTVRIPRSLLSKIPEPRGTWAADVVINELKKMKQQQE